MLDEIVAYMKEEVSMDGSLGSSPRRFIHHLSALHSPLNTTRPPSAPALTPGQIDKTAAYVWKEVVRTEGFKVINVLEYKRRLYSAAALRAQSGRKSAKKTKPAKKGKAVMVEEADDEDEEETETDRDKVANAIYTESQVPAERKEDMMALSHEFNESVSIVAEPMRIRLALTGNRIPNTRLSPTISTILEIVARARASGISMLDINKRAGGYLGKSSKNGAKNAFYYVKVLVELGLVAKMRGMEDNRTSSTIVHVKYLSQNRSFGVRMQFYELQTSPTEQVLPESEILGHDERTNLPIFAPFGPSSNKIKPFIRARLIRLLRSNLWHNLIENRDLLKVLGFEGEPTTYDRRQFQRFLSSFVQDGLIERVSVPSTYLQNPHHCLRLAELRPKEEESFDGEKLPVQDVNGLEIEHDDERYGTLRPYIVFDHTVTREYDVLRTIQQSGSGGQTIEEMSQKIMLGRKHLDGICLRYKSLLCGFQHVSDFLLFDVVDRIRRTGWVRWYTVQGYLDFCRNNHIEPVMSEKDRIAFAASGGFRNSADWTLFHTWSDYKETIDLGPHISAFHNSGKKQRRGTNGPAGVIENTNIVKGRPRKFVRVWNLERVLVKRSSSTTIKLMAGLPETMIFNKETKRLFPLTQAEIDGHGPITPPEHWEHPTGGGVGKTRIQWEAIGKGQPESSLVKPSVKKGRPTKAEAAAKKRARAVEKETSASLIALDDQPIDEPPRKRPRTTKGVAQNKKGLATASPLEDAPSATQASHESTVSPLPLVTPADLIIETPPSSIPGNSAETTAVYQQVGLEGTESGLVTARRVTSLIDEGRPSKEETPNRIPAVESDPHRSIPNELGVPALKTIDTESVAVDKTVQVRRTRQYQRIDHNFELKAREVLRFIGDSGGITLGRGFFASNLTKWQDEAKFGDEFPEKVISGRLDSRTLLKLVNHLVESGRLRTTTAMTMSVQYGQKAFEVLWLPDVSSSKVDDYVRGLQSGTNIPLKQAVVQIISEEAGFTRTKAKESRVRTARSKGDVYRASKTSPEVLHQMSPDEMRAVFRLDWRLLPQTYGWEPALARRMESFHRILIEQVNLCGDTHVRKHDVFLNIKVKDMCCIFPVVDHNSELLDIVTCSIRRETMVRDLDPELQSLLSPYAGKMKEKVARLCGSMITMGLISFCNKHEESQTEVYRPEIMELADYVKVASSAPIFDWSLVKSDDTAKLNVTIRDDGEIKRYWYLTWLLTMSHTAPEDTRMSELRDLVEIQPTIEPSFTIDTSLSGFRDLSAHLAGAAAWREGFVLNDAQRRYIQWLVEKEIDLESLEGNEVQTLQISYRIFAPSEYVVQDYLDTCIRHERRRRTRLEMKKRPGIDEDELRKAIQKKIEERQAIREESWSNLVEKACAKLKVEPNLELHRYVEIFHKRYLRDPLSFNTTQFFQVVATFFSSTNKDLTPSGLSAASVVPVSGHVRVRTHWTPQMEELARDAFIVIESYKSHLNDEARKHTAGQNAWSKVFPRIAPYKARRKVTEWVQLSLSNAEFLKRLRAEWELIRQNLTIEDLPDLHSKDSDEFDVLLHIATLRQNVKKTALLQRSRELEEGDDDFITPLPNSIAALNEKFTLVNTPAQVESGFRQYWQSRSSEQAKERELLSLSSTMSVIRTQWRFAQTRIDSQLEPTVKAIITSPAIGYREDQAEVLLQSFTKANADSKYRRMVKEGILARVEGKKSATGRGFRFADHYKTLRESPIPPSVFQDSQAANRIQMGDVMNWNVACCPGEFAGFAEMVSDNKVSLALDTHTVFKILDSWAEFGGNTRHVDDEHLELDLLLRKTSQVLPRILDASDLMQVDASDRPLANNVLELVESAGVEGIDPKTVALLSELTLPNAMVKLMALLRSGSIHCLGFSEARLVHTSHLEAWQIAYGDKSAPSPLHENGKLLVHTVEQPLKALSFQWLDIYGDVNPSEFQIALNSVFGHIATKPGVNEHILRGLVGKQFNRVEFNHLVGHLMDEKKIQRFCAHESITPRLGLGIVGLADIEDERFVTYMADGMMRFT